MTDLFVYYFKHAMVLVITISAACRFRQAFSVQLTSLDVPKNLLCPFHMLVDAVTGQNEVKDVVCQV